MPVGKGHRWCAKLIAWQISLTGKKKKKKKTQEVLQCSMNQLLAAQQIETLAMKVTPKYITLTLMKSKKICWVILELLGKGTYFLILKTSIYQIIQNIYVYVRFGRLRP